MRPTEATAAEAQAAIADEFSFFGDWSERYQYLIDLGRKLPPFPEDWKTEANRLQGCQSKVWIVPEARDGRLYFAAASDSSIVAGLVYLALRVYSGRTPAEMKRYIAELVEATGKAIEVAAFGTGETQWGLEYYCGAVKRIAER